MAHETRIPRREELDRAECWSTEDLFPSDEAWSRAFEACQSLPGELAAFRGKLGESAHSLYEYLEFNERLDERMEPLYIYAMLRHDENTADPQYQAMQGLCFSFGVEMGRAGAYAGPELTAIPEETLEGFYAQLPALEKYRRYLTKARLEREHILSPAEEDLLAGTGELSRGPSSVYTSYTNADMKFPSVVDSEGREHPVSNGAFLSLLESPDRTLRENAFKSVYGVYGASRNALAAMLDAQVRTDIFYARARKYPSALASALFPSEVPEEVYHNLLTAVHQNLDKLHRYMALRKKVLGLEELHTYDLYTSMLPEADQPVSFQQAREEVLEATRVLGEEYHRVLASSFDQRWMDIRENEGKRSGAYSCGCRVHPFVLLNHKDTLGSEFTLAHEMGHAMHSYLSNKNQPTVYSGYVLFVAEVASTCNEALLMQYLLGRTEDKKRRAVLINYFLEQFRTTLYRQAMFAEFELKIHELAESGEALTAQRLCEIYLDINKTYYGPDVAADPEIALEWSRIPHFYRRFYVYQYATGFSAAMALSKRILEGGEEAVRDYLKFLSGGCSADPVSLLKTAGVDMSTPKPVNDALEFFGALIGELEELLQ